MGKITTTILIALISVVAWQLTALLGNYLKARPFSQQDPVWLLLAIVLGYSGIQPILPTFMFNRVKLSIPGFGFYDHHLMHKRLGKNFILVTLGTTNVYIIDADIAYEIITIKKGFGRVDVGARMSVIFGPSLFSAERSEYRRQRRIVAPALNKRTIGAVWDESCTQARDMVNELARSTLDKALNKINETFEGLRTITINVIGSAGFSNDRSWSRAADIAKPPKGFETTSMQAVVTAVNNLIPMAFLSTKFLLLPIMPTAIKKIGIAKTEYPLHLQEAIAQRRYQAILEIPWIREHNPKIN